MRGGVLPMEQVYLPGTMRERVVELMKERKITQKQLAIRIGITESKMSRFLTGKVDKLNHEEITRMARVFDVSTDFLMGIIDITDRTNYDISELGLSAQAARNLYTGKVNAQVVNRLLENPRFAAVSYQIAQYFEDTLASGYAAQNQLLATVSAMMQPKNKEMLRDINALKTPVYQADLTTIQNTFLLAIKEIKKDIGSDLEAVKLLTKESAVQMFSELTRGQDVQQLSVTPEQIADAITGTVAGTGTIEEEALSKFNQALVELMQGMCPDKKDDAYDQ